MANYKDLKYIFPASSIASGTFNDARISSGNVTQHVTPFDDNKIINDLSSYFWNESLEKYKNSKSGYLFDKIKFINASIPKFTVLNKKELKYLSVFEEEKGGK